MEDAGHFQHALLASLLLLLVAVLCPALENGREGGIKGNVWQYEHLASFSLHFVTRFLCRGRVKWKKKTNPAPPMREILKVPERQAGRAGGRERGPARRETMGRKGEGKRAGEA